MTGTGNSRATQNDLEASWQQCWANSLGKRCSLKLVTHLTLKNVTVTVLSPPQFFLILLIIGCSLFLVSGYPYQQYMWQTRKWVKWQQALPVNVLHHDQSTFSKVADMPLKLHKHFSLLVLFFFFFYRNSIAENLSVLHYRCDARQDCRGECMQPTFLYLLSNLCSIVKKHRINY